ncbi:MAG: lipoprotein [Candidatus Omnitrophota bacterium]
MKKILCLLGLLLAVSGCQGAGRINRQDFSETLSRRCKSKYQATVTCRPAGNTIWVYLPYTPGRSGQAWSDIKEDNLYLQYSIASFNPYRTFDPPELRFMVQKVLGEIRQLLLECSEPYTFFVLVVTDISAPKNDSDQWYIGYFDDVKRHNVGRDFSGEGYRRLAWHQEKVASYTNEKGAAVSRSFRDAKGEHLDYREITLKEFIDKQIKWRVYKRFTIDYNKTPFDLTAAEKKEEIINIVKTVLTAYNFNGFKIIYFRDGSFLEEQNKFEGYSAEDIKQYRPTGKPRGPAF